MKQNNFIRYQDLLTIPVMDNKEKLTSLQEIGIASGYQQSMADMISVLGEDIFVRESVAQKLVQVQKKLQKRYPTLSLFVTYGYRSLGIQIKKFLEILKSSSKFYKNPYDLYEAVHESIAVPTVAGHPTGGAVDIVLVNTISQSMVDFGSPLYGFPSQTCYTFAKVIS